MRRLVGRPQDVGHLALAMDAAAVVLDPAALVGGVGGRGFEKKVVVRVFSFLFFFEGRSKARVS